VNNSSFISEVSPTDLRVLEKAPLMMLGLGADELIVALNEKKY